MRQLIFYKTYFRDFYDGLAERIKLEYFDELAQTDPDNPEQL